MTDELQAGRVPARSGGLRVVVWNIAQDPAAWAALDRLDPDICLLNEAVVPADRLAIWSDTGTHGRDGKRRPWSAAITSRYPTAAITDARPQWRHSRRNVPFVCSRPGSWVAARVETPMGAVTAVSLYGLMDELSDASMHRSLSECSPVFDDPRYSDMVLLGGDLNTGTQWPRSDATHNARDRGVLQRIEAYGLNDCVRATRAPGRLAGCPCMEGESCSHVRTRRDARHPAVPYQTDYLFASARARLTLSSCEVLASDEWFEISDHAPIVADFQAGSD
jgi:endonuclease/exonuclease/phosphatase family metal-dependent hydrolase